MLILGVILTYTILALAPKAAFLGIATASGSIAVGSRVPWAKYPVACVATQAYTNPSLGPKIIRLINEGCNASEALRRALSDDPEPNLRQVAVMTINGDKAVHNGRDIPREMGYYVGSNSVCIANLVVNSKLAQEMCKVFEDNYERINDLGEFVKFLLEALEYAHSIGGDKRGDRSSALLIVGNTSYGDLYDRIVDLRVDLSNEPIRDLKQLTKAYLGFKTT